MTHQLPETTASSGREAVVSGRHRAARTPAAAPPAPAWLPRTAAAGALALALVVGVLATASAASTPTRHGSGPAAPAASGAPATAGLDRLSRGAPSGAKLLSLLPVHVSRPAPATPAAVSALASDGIPAVALNAYRIAAARLATAQPGCGIQWWLLAGIGRVESNHGRYGGATLSPSGESTPHIIGRALDGTSYDYIADTDGGRLDSDTRFDHAVGPMQFIPSTWAGYGIDGNGDGTADPFNIDDAALAAARYLCAAGGDLRTAAGQSRAVLAYNHSDEYLALVLATARAYATGVPVDSPVTGVSTGALPPVGTDWLPPVNPGAPAGFTAAGGSRSTGPATSGRSAPSGTPAAGSGSTAAGPGPSGGGTGSGGAAGGSTGGSSPSAANHPASSAATSPASPPASQPATSSAVVVPLPTLAVPSPTATVVCTITDLLGNLIEVPCPR